ncbi:transglutaminase-like cysteine peptidase [Sphingomonas sp. HITSZ_GF]|uniref:transglutaminase-like cysteine peptidase n=1 Tax=Sphingomonas sp. HITSZ_GF TaxID=3037247 RepID=UPI00240D0021|nr:transglutaminase-like cysteine peptidase [Sphingomonas sp. HITSZ_GF]MDG2535996.1 transglutaminase-like cysteine peptidase [Sphingomonas sp. HITSZ_GF]
MGESANRSEVALRLVDAPRWTDVLAREAREAGGVARPSILCMMPADELPADCGARLDWRAGFQALRRLPMGERVEAVHARVNRLPYVSDLANWGMADRWETPAEMFARGGDCEDYALTKYFALRDLGLSEGAMRVAIVWDNVDQEQHAVLFVEVDGQSWVLDNKFAVPVPAGSVASRYRLIWSVNRDGARLSTTASAGEGGPRLRATRGSKMLVLSTRPIRRDQARPAPRTELASAGQGTVRSSADIARMGATILPAHLGKLFVAALPELPAALPVPARETALRNQLAQAGALAFRYAGK